MNRPRTLNASIARGAGSGTGATDEKLTFSKPNPSPVAAKVTVVKPMFDVRPKK
jgi:hypothetical protein